MIYMLLADGFEEIEALTPLDLLRRAGQEILTVSITSERAVTGAHGITVLADLTKDTLTHVCDEMLILPGGMPGTKNLDASRTVDAALRAANANGAYLAAICAAPMVLGKRGYLKGKEATCFPGFEEYLEGATLSKARVVTDGRTVTAAGMGVAMEFGLALVALLQGKDAAERLRSAVLAD